MQTADGCGWFSPSLPSLLPLQASSSCCARDVDPRAVPFHKALVPLLLSSVVHHHRAHILRASVYLHLALLLSSLFSCIFVLHELSICHGGSFTMQINAMSHHNQGFAIDALLSPIAPTISSAKTALSLVAGLNRQRQRCLAPTACHNNVVACRRDTII